MDMEMILSYLADLSANNNREWYHAHKADYRALPRAAEESHCASYVRSVSPD